MIWGYIEPLSIMKKCAELMEYSNGGITLEYIDHYMTPFERDEYWTTFYYLKKQRLDAAAKTAKNGQLSMEQAIKMNEMV